MALFETDYSAWDGIYYKVSEENNESFLQSLNPENKGIKTDLKGFFNRGKRKRWFYGFLYRNNRGFVWKDFLL